jgi:large subunit ribosomal protein L44e
MDKRTPQPQSHPSSTVKEKTKYPKEINTYCPKCKHHTAHAVAVYKAGKQRTLSWGARRQERRKHGYGGQKFPELKRTAKTTKKALVKLKCRTCNYTIERLGIRLRKLEVSN